MTSTTNPLFDALFRRHQESNKDFILFADGTRLSYRSFSEKTQKYAAIFDGLGIKKGDRVAFQLAKSVACLNIVAAAIQMGYIFLPLNPDYTTEEVLFFLKDSGARLFIGEEGNKATINAAKGLPHIEVQTVTIDGEGSLNSLENESSKFSKVMQCNENDIAALLYTSGTTGRSKGAMLTHKNLLSNARVLETVWKFNSKDVLLHALPIFHTHGLFVATNLVLLSGCSMLFLPKFDTEEIIRLIGDATVMMGVPTFYTRLLKSGAFNKEKTKSVRLFISGSAPLLSQTHKQFEKKTGHKILERYGMTETNMNTSNPYYGRRKAGSVGKALPGVQIKIVDEHGDIVQNQNIGSIQVKGDNVFKGYWNLPDKTEEDFTADGFFKTGDIGFKDKSGYIEIVGRDKDLIISGGFNVYPKEIELVIDEIKGVLESAVIGVHHPDFGEGVVALVVKSGFYKLSKPDIHLNLARKLAKYKRPKEVIFIEKLPRNSMGKVQKNVLRDIYSRTFSK